MRARGSRRRPPAPVPRPQWRARSRCGRRSPETPRRSAPRLCRRERAPAGSTDRRSSVSRVMSHRAAPISTPIARTRAPDATKEARRGSSGTWPRAVSRMSNRLSPSNEQPGEPGWTAAKKAPSARPVSPWERAEGAQPWRCDRLRTDPRRGSSRRQVLLSIRPHRKVPAGRVCRGLYCQLFRDGREDAASTSGAGV